MKRILIRSIMKTKQIILKVQQNQHKNQRMIQ